MRSSAALSHAAVPVSPRIPVEQIEAYYSDRKTQSLLDRYGPGPRVHYHSGIVKEPYGLHSSFSTLKGCIHRSQERLMARLAHLWRADSYLSGEVLDIGCGLGGGSIFWAEEFGATVTAVTCVPSHINWIAKFAKQAGVATQVQPLLSDAVEVPGENRFDAAVAIESSCHMPRRPLFNRLASLVRPGGRVFINDYFTNKQEVTGLFHRHWEAPLGSFEEYREAGEEAGLQLESVDDLTEALAPYWNLSAEFLKAEVKSKVFTPPEQEKQTRSLAVHTKVGRSMWNHDIEALALSFRKPQS